MSLQGLSRVEAEALVQAQCGTAQVKPQAGGQVAEVLQFLPPMSPAHQLLVQVHLVTCLIPKIDHPIPVIAGDHGAAKSTLSSIQRRLVDPAHEALLSLPKDQNELALLLARNYMAVFDNLDGLQDWQSEALSPGTVFLQNSG